MYKFIFLCNMCTDLQVFNHKFLPKHWKAESKKARRRCLRQCWQQEFGDVSRCHKSRNAFQRDKKWPRFKFRKGVPCTVCACHSVLLLEASRGPSLIVGSFVLMVRKGRRVQLRDFEIRRPETWCPGVPVMASCIAEVPTKKNVKTEVASTRLFKIHPSPQNRVLWEGIVSSGVREVWCGG